MSDEYDSFEIKMQLLENYMSVIEESVSEIRYLTSRAVGLSPDQLKGSILNKISAHLKRIHNRVHIGNKWCRWCSKTKEENYE